MAKQLTAMAKRKLANVSEGISELAMPLVEPMIAAAYPEDLAALENDIIRAAITESARTLQDHSDGSSRIRITPVGDHATGKFCLITLANPNMPFLFDSVMGEINEHAPSVHFVVHPVLDVVWKGDAFEIIDKSRPGHGRGEAARTSLITVLVDETTAGKASELEASIADVVAQVKAATSDWKPMLARIDRAIHDLKFGSLPAKKSDVEEAIAFMEWLRDNNFTLLGIREYDFVGGEKTGKLVRADRPSLGILSDMQIRVLRRGDEPVTTTPEIRAFLNSRDVLIVTKANAKSVVHRRTYLDYIGVKLYDEKGKLSGELRIVGLFTSTAYTRSVKRIPYIRSKIDQVLRRSEHDPESHSGKALINVLESYPRDELFQVDVSHLSRSAEAIVALADRPRIRVLSRIDTFDRFVSVIVFVPRERYDSIARVEIGKMLAAEYDAHVSAYYPAFPEGGLARVHFILGRRKGATPKPTQASLERKVADIVRTWEDGVRNAAASAEKKVRDAVTHFHFPENYRDTVTAERTLDDLRFMEDVNAGNPISVDFYREDGNAEHTAALRIFHHGTPVALSQRVPVLENMGFRVISETTYQIQRLDNDADEPIWLHDMQIESRSGRPVPMEDAGEIFEDAFLSVWRDEVDNDPFNGLVLAAGLNSRQITILRAYGRYLKQARLNYSQLYMASALTAHPQLAKHLYNLFDARMNPDRAADPDDDCDVAARHLRAGIKDMLVDVTSIDEDTILSRYLNVIEATLRTNFFAPSIGENKRATLAFKFDPHAITDLPEPRPYREIFVYGPEVEGVHLRFGPIARGGLRWSDRAEDYRTEVLGLVKAQQVKNAVIVPVGAKGGFFPKRLPAGGNRDEIFEAGKSAYVTFISSLLSLTDNLDGEKVLPPEKVVRHDGDDPYLVVAADKGTATFSDTANGISQEQDFWLDDAFASGGSAGYDHKKMGITARGAWEAVKRHFREMDKNIQEETFTAAGVGDMSGDVFGNGMLLSDKTRLIAAFDHRDIFIDPDPDPATSFKERQRMFGLGRSSWQDYDTKALSKGGGIYSRAQKLITLSKEAASAIGLDKTKASPTEIMQAILRANVELLWFGGIGTYIRASHENNSDVGDRANDAIRISAKEVGAKVIGEGANLGITQFARIEYGLHGGRCNSDAIDNSAGVNSSDVEVNIKIAFAPSLKDGSLTVKKRNTLLESMTENVADLVLANNYEQTLTISRIESRGAENLALQAQLMNSLEHRGLLDREVEMLPDAEALAEREADGLGLARAEIGVLLSYAKIVLLDDLIASSLPDDPYLEKELFDYFPTRMHKDFGDNIRNHRLRREIIATVLANEAVNRGGPSVISRFEDATGALPSDIVHAHIITRDVFQIERIQAAINALDNKLSGSRQLDLYHELAHGQRMAIGQYLKNGGPKKPLAEGIQRLSAAQEALAPKRAAIMPEYLVNWVQERTDAFRNDGLSADEASLLANLPVAATTADIAAVADATDIGVEDAGAGFYEVTKAFRIGRLEHLAQQLDARDYFDGLAQARALDTINGARMAITIAAIRSGKAKDAGAHEKVATWIDDNKTRISRVQERIHGLTDTGDLTVSRLTVAAGLLTDLVE